MDKYFTQESFNKHNLKIAELRKKIKGLEEDLGNCL